MDDNGRPRVGNVVIGVMLILLGVFLTLTRAGVVEWNGNWTLWPPILFGIGLASFLQSPAGGPKKGLLFMTAGIWLFGGEADWWSVADSWPLLVIAVGLIIALNSGRRAPWYYDRTPEAAPDAAGPVDRVEARRLRRLRRHERSLTPLAVIGIWIAIAVAIQVSGVRSFTPVEVTASTNVRDSVHVVSIMGRGHASPSGQFRGADVTTVMGGGELDLRDATIASGGSATVHVLGLMGRTVLRVPPTWRIDTQALSAMGDVRDLRFPRETADAAAEPGVGTPPRLVLRGLVAMGRLEIR